MYRLRTCKFVHFNSLARGATEGILSNNTPCSFKEVFPTEHGLPENCHVSVVSVRMPQQLEIDHNVRVTAALQYFPTNESEHVTKVISIEKPFAVGSRRFFIVRDVMNKLNTELTNAPEGARGFSVSEIDDDDEEAAEWEIINNNPSANLTVTFNETLAAMMGHGITEKKFYVSSTSIGPGLALNLCGTTAVFEGKDLVRAHTVRLSCNIWKQDLLPGYEANCDELIPLKPFLGDGEGIYEPRHIKPRPIVWPLPEYISFDFKHEDGRGMPFFRDRTVSTTDGTEVLLAFYFETPAPRWRDYPRQSVPYGLQSDIDKLENLAGFGF
jgi:hypothetical protein